MLTVAVVLYATLWPHPLGASRVMLFAGADKVVHAVMMGGITGALLFDWYRKRRKFTGRVLAWTAIAVAVFSGADELTQQALHMGRTAELGDLCADLSGVVIAILTAPPVIKLIFRSR